MQGEGSRFDSGTRPWPRTGVKQDGSTPLVARPPFSTNLYLPLTTINQAFDLHTSAGTENSTP